MSSLQYELETAQEKLRVYEELIAQLEKAALAIHLSKDLKSAKEFGELSYKAIIISQLEIEGIDQNEDEPQKVLAERFKDMDNYNDYLNEVKNTELS